MMQSLLITIELTGRTNMNIQRTLITAAAAFLASLAVNAEPLARANYDDSLQRCIAEIRGGISETGKLSHYVRDISRDRLWYEFRIDTVDATGAKSATSNCRAYRFEDRVRVERLAPEDATRLARVD